MNAIKAMWTMGQIVPAELVDWSEGSELLVELVPAGEKVGMTEDEWRDDPESITGWIARVNTIQPLMLSEADRVEMERYHAEPRRITIEAVREQMELGDES